MTEQNPPRKYQAFGTIEGVLNYARKHSTVLVGETKFPVVGYIPKRVRQAHLPEKIQRFKVFPVASHGKLGFRILSITESSEVGLNLKGCWEERQGSPYMVVYRNSLENPTDKVLRILIPVTWENPPPTDRQFWELTAEVRGDELTVMQAEGPFNPPRKATEYQPPVRTPKSKTTKQTTAPSSSTANAPPSIKPLTPQEIRDMATAVKAQVMCKLNQVPKHRELPDKRFEFILADGDRIFTVKIKPKMFKKLTDHGFTEWVASITGDLGPATETGFELENASLQIFQKKAKAEAEAKPEDKAQSAAASAVQRPEALKAEAKPEGKKSLLDGVKMR